MFSHYIKYLAEKFSFLIVIIFRFFILLVRRRKEIELLRFDYDKEHLFDKSFIIVNYRFRNAIYYRFGNHFTFEKEIKIFNQNNFEKEFELTVYGFFRNNKYKLKFEPKLTLETSKFKTDFINLKSDFEFQTIPNLLIPNFKVELEEIEIKLSKQEITNNKIELRLEPFYQNNFI